MRILTTLFALAALGCALAIAAAGPGSQMGWWSWGDGLAIIRKVATPVEFGPLALPPIFTAAALAALTGVISFFMGARGLGAFAILCAIAAGALGQIPLQMRADFEANPFIHDITTDFQNPPPIVAGASAERINPPDYLGGDLVPNSDKTVREAQAEAERPKPWQLDRCHAMRSDGELVRKWHPKWYVVANGSPIPQDPHIPPIPLNPQHPQVKHLAIP